MPPLDKKPDDAPKSNEPAVNAPSLAVPDAPNVLTDEPRSTLTSVDLNTTVAANAELVAKANRAAEEAYNKVMKDGTEKAGPDTLFEVMVDTWGFDTQFTRGQLVKASDIPYDVANAEQNGTIRRAPEYENVSV